MMILTAVGAAIVTGSAIGIYKHLPKPYYTSKLRKLCIAGGLFLTQSRKGFDGKSYENKITPHIKRVGEYEDHVQLIFGIPTGMNPQIVSERFWLFQQGFGRYIEIQGDHQIFNLEVYEKGIDQFEYDLEEIKPVIKDFIVPIVSGKTRKGYIAYDMAEHPHLLIAGETGSGKSVQLRSIITTLIATRNDTVDLYLADMKRSEFHLFRGAAEAVVVEELRLHSMLLHIKKEMTKRGDLLDSYELDNIKNLPKEVRPNYIVVAIDEVALLKKNKDVMTIIEDVSAIGRALGVFLILSMQRPDAQVLDGKLKNNLTVRMAFRHKDAINSRITLDSDDATKIGKNEKGRNYLALESLYNVQAPFLPLEKAKKILEPFKIKPITKTNDDVIEVTDFEVVEDELEAVIEFGGLADD